MPFINGRYYGRGLLQTTGKTMSSSTITISGSAGYSPLAGLTAQQVSTLGNISLDSFASSSWKYHPDVKKYEVYESPEDLLTLSCTLARMRENNQYGHKILDREVVSNVSVEDRDLAQKIKDYYSKKIMMWKLKNTHMSKFRDDLNKFVHGDGLVFKENTIGLACYLPDFYKYDVAIDDIKLQTENKVVSRAISLVNTHKLIPLNRIVKKSQRMYSIEYWFKNSTTNEAVMLSLEKKNPLENVWNNIFLNSESLEIKGNYHPKNNDEYEYFFITNWDIA